MINQYFNVYTLRRVRCAGYATENLDDLRLVNVVNVISTVACYDVRKCGQTDDQ